LVNVNARLVEHAEGPVWHSADIAPPNYGLGAARLLKVKDFSPR
jgi:hypothetical protein